MNRRRALDRQPITSGHLYKLMRRLLPKANDYGEFSGEELIGELNYFGVRTRKQVRLLLKKHRREVIDVDRAPIEPGHERAVSQEFDLPEFRRTRVWFAYPGLLRVALELEFGDAYRRFADARDGIQGVDA